MKKQFLILFAFISVLALSQVPQRFNKVIVTGDITSPKFIKTGSTVDSVLLGNGSARSVNSLKTDTINLSNRINAKAAGNGTANGTNTGDETLTSIKTKLGAATSVSDGYLKYQDFVRFDGKQPAGSYLTFFTETDPTIYSWAKASTKPSYTYSEVGAAPSSMVSNATHTGDVTGSTVLTLATVNSNIGTFNNITINSKGLATAGSNVSYEPSFSKNTGFNKPFGNTPGTVLEGRTFGTAANSAVGDFIQNQNSSAQSANIWISGDIKAGAATFASSVNASGIQTNNAWFTSNMNSLSTDNFIDFRNDSQLCKLGVRNPYASFGLTFVDPSNNYYKIFHEGNLFSNPTVNQLQKWHGSSFVNSLISDDGVTVSINKSSATSIGLSITNSGVNGSRLDINSTKSGGHRYHIGSNFVIGAGEFSIYDDTNSANRLNILSSGEVRILSTTPSTSPTTGALVTPGGVGADHVRANNFYGNGSNLTGVQLPITLTTNGTSGAATLTGTTLNIPNYTIAPSSGNYAQSITLLSGLASSASTVAMYTKNGNNYHVGLSGVLTTNAAGTCSFRIQLPSSVTGSNAVVIPHIFGLSGSYVAHSYASSFGSTNVVDISFISTSVSGSSFNYNVMIDYY